MRGIAAVHGGNAVEMQVHLLPGGQRPRLRQDFIYVHHTLELSRVPPAYQVDPVNDLRPVRPNCHAMIHRGPGPRFPSAIQRQRCLWAAAVAGGHRQSGANWRAEFRPYQRPEWCVAACHEAHRWSR